MKIYSLTTRQGENQPHVLYPQGSDCQILFGIENGLGVRYGFSIKVRQGASVEDFARQLQEAADIMESKAPIPGREG